MNFDNRISSGTSNVSINSENHPKQKEAHLVAFCGIGNPVCPKKIPLDTLKGYFLKTSSANISFGHRIEEHSSYGVTFNYDDKGKTSSAKAKIFTYPDVEKVEIQVAQNNDAEFLDDYKSDVSDKNLKSFQLENKSKGIFEGSDLNINPGDRYRFKLTFPDGKTKYISDLYSYSQKSLTAWPVAYDQKAYGFSDEGKKLGKYSADWNKGKIAGKVDNIKSLTDSNFISSKDLRLVQVHIGTFTEKGQFDDAIKKLDEVKRMGFNGVEILPHGFFNKTNWGYDPAFVFASQYGGTDKFKKFCDEAHKRGLNVIVDVVNNHYSMDHPEIMTEAGPYENPDPAMKLEFGPRINYTHDGKDSVRDWRVNESLYWLQMADGIRYDLSDFTGSGEFNTQLNMEIQEHFPGTVTFAESASREATNPLPEGAIIKDLPEGSELRKQAHSEIIKKAQNDEFGPNNQGYTHAWDFGWSHAIEYSMLHPSNRNIGDLKNHIFDGQKQMKIMFSHDEIGKQEADGNDIVPKIMLSKLFGQDVGDLGWGASRDKTEKYWKASRAVRELTRIYLTEGEAWPSSEKQLAKEQCKGSGDINDFNNENYGIADYQKGGLGLGDFGWIYGISKEEFGEKFNAAASINKAGMAFMFSQPGPKMVFQTFDNPDRRFAFFRKNSDYFYETFNRDEKLKAGVDWETQRKGHRLDSDDIINQANLDAMNGKYNKNALDYQKNMKTLIGKLNEMVDQNPALSVGEVKDVVGNHPNVISVLTKKDDNEIYSITHFDDSVNYTNYNIYFPEGTWKEVLNTNDKEFGGDGNFKNDKVNGGDVRPINLPKASTIMFKRVG